MPYSSLLLSSSTEALMTLLRHCFSAPEGEKINSDGIQKRQDIRDKLRDMKKEGKKGRR